MKISFNNKGEANYTLHFVKARLVSIDGSGSTVKNVSDYDSILCVCYMLQYVAICCSITFIEKHTIYSQLTTLKYNTIVPAMEDSEIRYVFYSEMQPQELELVADLIFTDEVSVYWRV